MKEIIKWLLQMEKLAGDLYRRATDKFSQDQEFSTFLSKLAEDEDMHFQLIKDAEQRLLERKERAVSAIVIDQEIKGRVETPLRDIYERMATHNITKPTILKIIAKVEFAELNNVFLYVVNTFKKDEREIQNVASAIQRHIKRIEKFLKEHTDELDLSDVIRKLPRIGGSKILVVEDKRPLQEFISQTLKESGIIETATNGQEALHKMRKSTFDVIISGSDTPGMSGIEFFQKAVEIYPNIAKHFLFCTRDISPDMEVLCKVYDLRYLKIPFGINQLHEAVQSIIYMKK